MVEAILQGFAFTTLILGLGYILRFLHKQIQDHIRDCNERREDHIRLEGKVETIKTEVVDLKTTVTERFDDFCDRIDDLRSRVVKEDRG